MSIDGSILLIELYTCTLFSKTNFPFLHQFFLVTQRRGQSPRVITNFENDLRSLTLTLGLRKKLMKIKVSFGEECALLEHCCNFLGLFVFS